MPIASLSLIELLMAMMMRPSLTVSIDEYDIDMVDGLSIAYEHETSIDESTWKDGYKSKDINEFDFYFGYDFVPSQDDACYLGSELIQDDGMLCDSLQDAEDLLCNSSSFSDSCKSFTWDSLTCSHISILHDF